MNKIKLNNHEFEVENYNRTLQSVNSEIASNGYCTVWLTDDFDIASLMQETITSVQIYHDESLIYDLDNLNAKIYSANEYLNGDHMVISLNLNFSGNQSNDMMPA